MRALQNITPTPEQLALFSRIRDGVEIIRGSAGSGKTTTALLRLRSLVGMFSRRKRRQGGDGSLRVLILTYNRTLKGYIEELANQQSSLSDDPVIEIATFGKWARDAAGRPSILDDRVRRDFITEHGAGLGLNIDFLLDEIEYVLGRFLPNDLEMYYEARREGRGIMPRVDKALRERIVSEVIRPYNDFLEDKQVYDWDKLAVYFAENKMSYSYDIIIVDETQDFSANQLRAISNQLSEEHSLTFIVDTAQRIYARGFTWQEAGIIVRPENVKRLKGNYRNTVEIARFGVPLLSGLPVDDDASMPDLTTCTRSGVLPKMLIGKYSFQVAYAIRHIQDNIDLSRESVAFLHPRGGRCFGCLRDSLSSNNLQYVEMTRRPDWPDGDENIALCTLHSAKGLEFDHVMILGLSAEFTSHGDDENDDRLIKLRRLLAMGISRARESVILGYKLHEESRLISFLDNNTFESVRV